MLVHRSHPLSCVFSIPFRSHSCPVCSCPASALGAHTWCWYINPTPFPASFQFVFLVFFRPRLSMYYYYCINYLFCFWSLRHRITPIYIFAFTVLIILIGFGSCSSFPSPLLSSPSFIYICFYCINYHYCDFFLRYGAHYHICIVTPKLCVSFNQLCTPSQQRRDYTGWWGGQPICRIHPFCRLRRSYIFAFTVLIIIIVYPRPYRHWEISYSGERRISTTRRILQLKGLQSGPLRAPSQQRRD